MRRGTTISSTMRQGPRFGIMIAEAEHTSQTQTDDTTCCIVGAGPAGVVLGFLLARAGIDVLVLEKHKDFFRDFRGDTIHPSTLEIMHELGAPHVVGSSQ